MPEFVSKIRLPRRTATALIALLGAIALAFTSAVAWAATTVLVVPGTGTKNPSLVPGYQENSIGYYVQPTGACDAGGCTATPVPYIAEFWPIPLEGWGGLEGAKWDDSVASGVTSLNTAYADADKDSPIVIFGYSQGGTVVSAVKKQLSEQPGGVPDTVSFVLIGNASRPNGGLFTRPSFLGHIPILDVTFGPGTPTNTSTTVNTTDVAFQYDGVTDFPRYPLNPLATANALAGFWYVHGKYLAPKGDDPATATPIGYTPDEMRAAVEAATANCTADTYCQVSGDTRYVTLPAKILPLALPLLDLGAQTGTTPLIRPLIDLASPVARVLIETGYTRDDYGRPTPFGIAPVLNPFTLGLNLIGATVQGVQAAVTGTGDASKYLESTKPAATPTTTSGAPTEAASTAPAAALAVARSARESVAASTSTNAPTGSAPTGTTTAGSTSTGTSTGTSTAGTSSAGAAATGTSGAPSGTSEPETTAPAGTSEASEPSGTASEEKTSAPTTGDATATATADAPPAAESAADSSEPVEVPAAA
ncbi:PE-PPE domain-containing protein [Tsukamurella sp. 1534]|uniref:PE-PPE domain-containing protein n=1 Tax=Tsukamurella sp. 1534 TaxID=1151061 RepID=UPI0006ACC15E|nr:PE-PPE domain-containing protein [Tsukamurella sp. 1534]